MGANTPDGFVGFFDKMADNYPLKKLYILKGGSGVGKSTFIRNFAQHFITQATQTEAKLTVDYILCSADPDSYDGAILHEAGIAIIDGTSPHITDPKYPGLVEEIIDLAQFIDTKKIRATREKIRVLQDKRKECFRRATAELAQARIIHAEVETIFTASVDFKKVDRLLEKLISEVG